MSGHRVFATLITSIPVEVSEGVYQGPSHALLAGNARSAGLGWFPSIKTLTSD